MNFDQISDLNLRSYFSRLRIKTKLTCKFAILSCNANTDTYWSSNLLFSIPFLGACLRKQPKIQRRKVHYRNGPHDKRQRLGLTSPKTKWTKNFIFPMGLKLDFVQRMFYSYR